MRQVTAMDEKRKMNGLFVAGFVLAIVSVLACGGAALLGFWYHQNEWAAVVGGAGAFLAFLGIIFAYCSKPKKEKKDVEATPQD